VACAGCGTDSLITGSHVDADAAENGRSGSLVVPRRALGNGVQPPWICGESAGVSQSGTGPPPTDPHW